MRTRYGSRRILLCMQLCFICLALGLPGNSWGTLSSEVYFNEVSPEIDVTLQTSGGNISTHAGHYNVTVQNTYPENEFWEGSFDGFCVDVYQNAISDWKSYDLVEINADYQEAAWLLGNYSDYADAASAQLAVWEVVTETDTSFDLGTGTFTATAGGGHM